MHSSTLSSFIRNTTMAENNNSLGSSFMQNFSCKICLEVFHDPVQCQHNEHYFCRKCITKHLENSETCPLCMDQLTLETLRPPSRIILDIVSQLKKPRCSHVSRGCTENVQVEELLLHEQTCGYAPVVCWNEGCKETVNRRDKESHETEECKFRKITCESCDEELVHVDFEKHQCTLRKEINEVKSRLDEMSEVMSNVVLPTAKPKCWKSSQPTTKVLKIFKTLYVISALRLFKEIAQLSRARSSYSVAIQWKFSTGLLNRGL